MIYSFSSSLSISNWAQVLRRTKRRINFNLSSIHFTPHLFAASGTDDNAQRLWLQTLAFVFRWTLIWNIFLYFLSVSSKNLFGLLLLRTWFQKAFHRLTWTLEKVFSTALLENMTEWLLHFHRSSKSVLVRNLQGKIAQLQVSVIFFLSQQASRFREWDRLSEYIALRFFCSRCFLCRLLLLYGTSTQTV